MADMAGKAPSPPPASVAEPEPEPEPETPTLEEPSANEAEPEAEAASARRRPSRGHRKSIKANSADAPRTSARNRKAFAKTPPTKGRRSSQAATQKPKMKRGRKADPDENALQDDSEPEEAGVTRCVCGKNEDDSEGDFMIQCDVCKSWQHGPCMGLDDESSCPETYYCERCRPEMHPMGFLSASKRSVSVLDQPSRDASRERSGSASVSASLDQPPQGPQSKPSSKAKDKGKEVDKDGKSKSARGRSTMNSRDAAYEQELALALKLSKVDAGMADELGSMQGEQRAPEESTVKIEEEQHDVDMEDTSAAADNDVGLPPPPKPISRRGGPRKKGVTVREMEAALGIVSPTEPSATPTDAPKRGPGGVKRKKSTQSSLEDDEEAVASPDVTEPPSKRPRARPSEEGGAEEETAEAETKGTPEPGEAEVFAHLGKEKENADSEADWVPPAPAPRKKPGAKKKGPAPKDDSASGGKRVPPSKQPGWIPRSKISPNKRPPLDRNNRWANHTAARPEPPPEPVRLDELEWSLPEHLTHLSHLLPSTRPVPLSVPSLSGTSANPPQDSSTNSVAPSPSASTSSQSSQSEHTRALEAPTRIRYPAKRMSMPDMKKRSKTMLDFLARIQLEMADRSARNASGASAASTPAPGTQGSIEMMDDLSRDLIKFQEKYFC